MKKKFKKAIAGLLSFALIIMSSGCATSTVTRREYERIVNIDQPGLGRQILTKREFSIPSFQVGATGLLTGKVVEKQTSAIEMSVKKEKRYDLVTQKSRRLTNFEYTFHSLAKYPQQIILLPFSLAWSILALPFEAIVGHGLATVQSVDVPSVIDLGEPFIERKTELVGISSRISSPQTISKAGVQIPITTEPGGRRVADSDADGQFSFSFLMPRGVVSEKVVRELAIDALRPVFLRDADVSNFLRAVKYSNSIEVKVSASTDAKSVVKDWEEQLIITEGSASISVQGFQFDENRLMASLRDYLHEVALSAIDIDEVDVTIEVRDSISRTLTYGQTSISLELTDGITANVLRNQMLAALRKLIKPEYVRNYLPPDSELPQIKRFPENAVVVGEKRFRIHVPAIYKIRAANPDYVYLEGEKTFSMNARTATIYMNDRGTKQRVSITDGSAQASRIE